MVYFLSVKLELSLSTKFVKEERLVGVRKSRKTSEAFSFSKIYTLKGLNGLNFEC